MNLKNNLNSGISVLKYRLFNKKTPLSVILSVTSKCNFNCKYCHVSNQRKKDMSTKQILTLIDQIVDAGTQRLGIQGGEPLLRKDIGEIIDYSKSKGLFVTLGSNGSLLPEKIDKVKDVDVLVLSFDGPSAHDKYRKEGSYIQLIDAIKLARENDIEVWNTTVLSNYGINDVDEVLRLAQELDFKTYFTPLMQIPETTGMVNELFPTEKELKKAIKKIIIRKKQGKPILNSYEFLEYAYKWPDFRKTQFLDEELPNKNKLRCFASELFCHIDTNGDVYPCINMMYKTEGYDVLKLGFKDAFEKSSKSGCKGCTTFSFVELNLLFNLKFGAFSNLLKNY